MTVITAPTGNIGSKVLNGLIASGEKLRVVVRNKSKLSENILNNVEVVEGSMDSLETMSKALRGAHQLFLIVPPSNQYHNADNYYMHFSNIICEAIKKENVKRVVFVSGTGLGFDKKAGPVASSFLVERQLIESKIDLRILHCGTFMENLFHSTTPIKTAAQFGTTVPADVKIPWVATKDIADVALNLLKDKSWKGQSSVGVLGPKDLSYGEIAGIMTEVLKKEITYNQVPIATYKEMLQKFGSSEAAAQGLVDIYSSMTKGTFNRVERTTQNTTPTTFYDWCETVLKPMLA